MRACAGLDAVIELGCGDGRVLRQAEAGVRIGVETEDEMLALARGHGRENITWVQADASTYRSPAPVDAVIVPYTTMYALAPASRTAAIALSKENLRPGGRLLFDVWSADAFHLEEDPEDPAGDAPTELAGIVADGEHWTVTERSAWDREAQTIDVTYTCQSATRSRKQHLRHHYAMTEALADTVRGTGLIVERILGSFGGEPWHRDAELAVFCCRAP